METEKEMRSAVSLMPVAHLVKLLVEKGLITEAEFTQKLSAERAGIRRCWGRYGRQNDRYNLLVDLSP